jgi:Tol biopolymer transport system component
VTSDEADLNPADNTVSQETDVQPVSIISGQKFADLNGNGVHDPGEPGLNGVTIELVDPQSGQVVATTQTHDVDLNGDGTIDPQTERGLYSFRIVGGGSFTVREQPSAGYVLTFPAGGGTERLSVSNTGTQADRLSYFTSISADGRFVAFDSAATNLVPGDDNGQPDVFVYDRQTGTIERESVPDPSTGQREADNASLYPAISADGRFVTFQSFADNLVTTPTHGLQNIFVHDRLTGATLLVSAAADGTPGDQPSGPDEFGRGPSISSDGRFIAFESYATNFVAGDTNNAMDVFVKDMQTGMIQRVSVNDAGQQSTNNKSSYDPSISADGRYVAFDSAADNFVPGDTNDAVDVFVYDRQTSTIERVSTDSAGNEVHPPIRRLGNAMDNPVISADGRFVAFESDAPDLVPGDTNGVSDVFVKDLQTGQVERVSVDSTGAQAVPGSGAAGSHRPAISADGRYVAFDSTATNLVPGDTNGFADVFVHDRQTGQTVRVSVDSTGDQTAGAPQMGDSTTAAIDADGHVVAFQSDASNLVPNDTNLVSDIFVHDSGGNGSYSVTLAAGHRRRGWISGTTHSLPT